MTDLRYPIGTFAPKDQYTPEEISAFVDRIETLPARLEAAVQHLTPAQFDTPYRAGGWTVRQVVHHVADSHLNSYIRVKWTLTEPTPTIKAYDEKAWAETPDYQLDPALSLQLLKALHAKWVALYRSLRADDLQREFIHPETKKSVRLDRLAGLYAWHGDHHLAHITGLKERMGWR
jgi:hypothetical protein